MIHPRYILIDPTLLTAKVIHDVASMTDEQVRALTWHVGNAIEAPRRPLAPDPVAQKLA